MSSIHSREAEDHTAYREIKQFYDWANISVQQAHAIKPTGNVEVYHSCAIGAYSAFGMASTSAKELLKRGPWLEPA
jgi:hypothetical protein